MFCLCDLLSPGLILFFFNDTATTEIYTLSLHDALPIFPVWVLFAGTLREHPLELLQSSQLPQLLDQFTESFDWIVIDAPPLLPLADADLWTRLSDGVLLVIRENKTRKKILQKALDTLKNATLL